MHKVVQGWAGLCWDGSMTHRVATSAPPPPIPDQVCVWGEGCVVIATLLIASKWSLLPFD